MAKTTKTTKTAKRAQTVKRAKSTTTKRARKPQLVGPVMSDLPRGFDAWVLAQARRPVGLRRPQVIERSGQRCKWRPYLTQLAERNGMTCSMRGRPAVFFFTRLRKTAAGRSAS